MLHVLLFFFSSEDTERHVEIEIKVLNTPEGCDPNDNPDACEQFKDTFVEEVRSIIEQDYIFLQI